MFTFKNFAIGLVLLTIYFGVQSMTVEDVLRGAVDVSWGMVNVLLGGRIANAPNRQLPQNQGDSEEYIKPIEELEEIK